MSVTITRQTYNGASLENIFTRMRTGFDTEEKGVARIITTKESKSVPLLGATNGFQDYTSGVPTDEGTYTITERIIDPKKHMKYTVFDPEDFEGDWFEEMFTDPLLGRLLPNNVYGAVLNEFANVYKEDLESFIWNSDTAVASAFPNLSGGRIDGFMKKIESSVAPSVGSPVVLTAANIEEKIRDTYNLLPDAVRKEKRRLKILTSYATEDLYGYAQWDTTNKGGFFTDGANNRWNGIEMVSLAGVPADTIIIGMFDSSINSNLWIGFNSLLDEGNLVIDKTDNRAETFFVKMANAVDVQIRQPEELAYYHV